MPYKDPARQREAQRKYEETKRKGKRHKLWTWIMYDESSPDWKEGLESVHVPCVISPVHDRDVWTKRDERKNPKCKAGKPKKDHRHGLMEFEQQITFDEFMQVMSEAGISTTNVKWVRSCRAMSRYLTHMDSPDKARYADDEVTELSGACWAEMCEREEDVHAILREMREFVVYNEVSDLWAFQMWTDAQEDLTWSRTLDARVYGMEKFIASFRAWREKNPEVSALYFLDGTKQWSKSGRPLRDMGQCVECGAWLPKDELVEVEGYMVCADCHEHISALECDE
jgi:hypothetical protein